jgi:phosphotransferase system HPr (HPr) family protein
VKSLAIEVRNPSGLHARPAALLVRTAAGYRSAIRIRNTTRSGEPVDAKSILSVLGIGVSKGHVLELIADGDDEGAAIAGLLDLIESGIGESLEAEAGNGT